VTHLTVWTKEGISFICFINCTCNWVCCRALTSCLFNSCQASTEQLLFLILTAVFGWTHFAILLLCIYAQLNRKCC